VFCCTDFLQTLQKIEEAFGMVAVKKAQVYTWLKRFHDNPRCGLDIFLYAQGLIHYEFIPETKKCMLKSSVASGCSEKEISGKRVVKQLGSTAQQCTCTLSLVIKQYLTKCNVMA
jgi:hypothetical protein